MGAFQIPERGTITAMSPFDASTGPINRKAAGQSPAYAKDGLPRDGTRPDKGEATGGPGPSFFARQHDICDRLRSEVVWEPEVGQLLSDAANEIERLRNVAQEPVAWRAYADDGSEAVYSLYEQARAAADEWHWSVEPLYRTPQPHATPGEGTSQAGCIDRTQTGKK